MAAFLASILAFPTVIFTVPLALSLVYWLFVIIGALDLDLFDSLSGGGEALDGVADGALDGAAHAAADGVLDGVADGAVDGVLDGAAHGAADGVLDGAVDGAAHGVEGAAHAGPVALIASILRLGKVPVTISFSLVFLIGWTLSGIAMSLARPHVHEGLLGWLLRAGLGLGAFIGSVALTSLFLRPLERVFVTQKGLGAADLVGQRCTLTTSSISATFGQASAFVGDSDLVLQVRRAAPNDLHKGDELLLVDYDRGTNAYSVEPYAQLLGELSEPNDEPATRKPGMKTESNEVKE